MKELKCSRCGDLFVQGYASDDEVCDQCFEEMAVDIPDEPDMSGADKPGDEGNR
jgi:hypothetical protein